MSRYREFSEPELTKAEKMRETRIPTNRIAKYLNTTKSTLEHLFRKDKKRFGIYNQNLKNRSLDYLVQPFYIESYDKFEVLTGDWMLCGDTHIPYHNIFMMNNMIKVARRDGIKKLAVVGDFADHKLVSIYLNINSEKNSRKLTDDAKIMVRTLKTLGKTFDEIVLVCGDHDARLLQMLKYQANWKGLFELFSEIMSANGVRASDYYYAILKSGDQIWRLTHPDKATRRSTTKALSFARKFDQNILQCHGHTFGMEFTENGKYLAVSMGCMTSVKHHEYAVIRDMGYPTWRKQFAKIQNGRITIYDESSQLTDWNAEFGRKK